MAKYKIIKEFVLNGVPQKLNSIVELDYKMSHLKSIQENIEKVPDNTPSVNGSVLGSIKPGEQLTPEQKEKLAKENAAETAEAQRLAAEHRARDMAEGKGEPVVAAVAGALKEKLQNEEFQTKPEVPPAA